MHGEHRDAKREHLKELAGRWEKRFDDAIDAIQENDEATFDDLIGAIWEKGMLGRIAPEDPQEANARKDLGKTVWEGKKGRDDEDLYWSIIYCLRSQELSMKARDTIAAADYTGGGMSAVYQFTRNNEKQRQLFGDKSFEDIFLSVGAAITEKAKGEITRLGGTPPTSFVELGAQGTVNGIDVIVERYTGEGKLSLKARNFEDHAALYEITPISASKLNPEEFKVPSVHVTEEVDLSDRGKLFQGMRTMLGKLPEGVRPQLFDASPKYFEATKPFEGKKVNISITFTQEDGVSFQVEEI